MEQVDEYVRVAPAPALRPHVAWYSGYRQRGLPPALHRGLPSPALTLIFTLDEPLTLLDHEPAAPQALATPGHPAVAAPGHPAVAAPGHQALAAPGNQGVTAPGHRAFDTLVGGLHLTPALITHQGAQSGVQLALRPLGARALLGLPAGELAAQDMPADAVLGPAAHRLSDRLRAAPGWPERFAVLDEELSVLVRTDRRVARDVPPELRRAWHLLRHGAGGIPVSTIASEVGWSTRHLGSRFRTEIGFSPKAAARVIRFDRARRLLSLQVTGQPLPGTTPAALTSDVAAVGPRLADLAAACGYFDQAHLARDFRALAGCSPSAWLATEFRFVQASGSGFDESLDGPGPAGHRVTS